MVQCWCIGKRKSSRRSVFSLSSFFAAASSPSFSSRSLSHAQIGEYLSGLFFSARYESAVLSHRIDAEGHQSMRNDVLLRKMLEMEFFLRWRRLLSIDYTEQTDLFLLCN